MVRLLGAMLVLHIPVSFLDHTPTHKKDAHLYSKQRPHATSKYFGNCHEESQCRRMLHVMVVDGIKDPVASKDWIQDHGDVVHPRLLVAQNIPQKRMTSVWIAQAYHRVSHRRRILS